MSQQNEPLSVLSGIIVLLAGVKSKQVKLCDVHALCWCTHKHVYRSNISGQLLQKMLSSDTKCIFFGLLTCLRSCVCAANARRAPTPMTAAMATTTHLLVRHKGSHDRENGGIVRRDCREQEVASEANWFHHSVTSDKRRDVSSNLRLLLI